MAKRVIVTGGSGLLGRQLVQRFASDEWDCLGLAYSRARGKLRKVDLCDASQVEHVLDDFQPSVVVHSAAERRPDVVEKKPEATDALNVAATGLLAELCSKRGIFLLYMSTDYVFDGRNPPYKPGDTTNPLNTYGQTKRDGENIVLKQARNAVLRVPVLYGEIENLGESAVTTLFSAVLDSSKPSKMSDYERRYPTHVADVAQVCVQLASTHVAGKAAGGVWHWSGSECLTKYSMACAMAGVFNLSSSHLVPISQPSGGAPRPYDCHLDTSATQQAYHIQSTPFTGGIKQVLEPFYKPVGQ